MTVQPFEKDPASGTYRVVGPVTDKDIMEMATKLISQRFRRGRSITAPKDMRAYLTLKLAELDHEVFGMVLLDSRHCVLGMEIIFRGTIDGASVYPRELVKQTLNLNASAAILFHNHPSGSAEPSKADQMLTSRIIKAFETIDVRVLDHLIIGGTEIVSFAERGLL